MEKINFKSEAERLIKRFTTFINFDQTLDATWHDPSPANEKRHKLVKRNSIRLAIICADELLMQSDDENVQFYAMVKSYLEEQL